jgi:hypothetical protein
MSVDLIDGLWISLIVTIAAIVLCPILCWVLPPRQA